MNVATTIGRRAARLGEAYFAPLFRSSATTRAAVVLILILCAIGNLPWNLDEYDQAKQAYVSYEIAQGGSWLHQHTPRGGTATKPPLAGWISLGLYELMDSWNLAWRLPGFLCTIVLLGLLLHEGNRMLPDGGALLAAAAFGLNLLTPRISTLVRTDMLLTLWIFLCGWLIYRKVRDAVPWSTGERWAFFAAMLGALMTKGPIIHAFLLPGLVAYVFLAPRERRGFVWSGWWTWVLPLAVFAAWGACGLLTNREFYNDVVVREFFSRFDQSLKSHERQQPVLFYFPHLLHKFLPWSLLAVALPVFSKNVREAVRRRPELLWLACWALGGLLCMTLVPSKRVDRIYPIIPPLCLLLVGMLAACRCGGRVRAWAGAAVVAGALFSGIYFFGIVVIGYHDKNDRLVDFARTARRTSGARPFGVVDGRDEGMVIYADGGKFLSPDEALALWNKGNLNALLVPGRRLADLPGLPPPSLESGPINKHEDRYFLFLRDR